MRFPGTSRVVPFVRPQSRVQTSRRETCSLEGWASKTRKPVQLGTIRLGRKYGTMNPGLRLRPPQTILSLRRVRSGASPSEDGRPKATAIQESRELENGSRGRRAVGYVNVQPQTSGLHVGQNHIHFDDGRETSHAFRAQTPRAQEPVSRTVR